MAAVQRPVVLDDSVELIISSAREKPPVSGAVELLKDFARPMAAPGLWHDKKGRVSNIRNVPLIGSTTDDWDWRSWAAENEIGFEQLRVAYRFDTDAAVLAACRAGLGIALVPTESGHRDSQSGQLVPFGDFRERCYGVYWLATAPRLRRPAHLFVNWLLKVAPGIQPRPGA
jgi:DNA-binding transcriptional LysR family regulator